MRVLSTGGAGYVGGHCHRAFTRAGIHAIALDDLSEGNREAVEPGKLRVVDIRDTEAVARVLRDDHIDAVVHFAALVSVSDSLKDPQGYWSVNVGGTKSVLDAMVEVGVKRIVASSTAAVYAHDARSPIAEDAAISPQTPYGSSKLATEYMIRDYAATFGLTGTMLRYFNASGAEADGAHGEARRVETHVVPLLLESALGLRGPFKVFGGDWPTPDGSCVRDFVSLADLARAHQLAAEREAPGAVEVFNLGGGRGTSILELIAAAERIAGRPIPYETAPRRPGDPPMLVADVSKAARGLGWRPETSDIDSILRAAWGWHSTHPKGYATPSDAG